MNLYPNGLTVNNSNNKSTTPTHRKFHLQQLELDDEDDDNLLFDDKNSDDPTISKDNNIEQSLQQISLEQIICEDLHAFENRLMEIIQGLEPKTKRWRWVLALSIVSTIITATQWLLDMETFESSFWQSLWNHHWFAINCLVLIGLFLLLGIHKRVIQQNIIAQRIREVVGQFNMGCDDHGRLILMPRPPSFYENHLNHHQYLNHFNHNYSPPLLQPYSNGYKR